MAEFAEYQTNHPNASNVQDEAALSQHTSEDEQEVLMRTLAIKKGKCPEEVKGVYHKLLKLAYMPKSIETIYELGDNDVLYLFYTNCVSQSVGKRKWNQYSKTKALSTFVSPADEAFAMLVIENNVAKWMNEVRFGKNNESTYQFKTLYTEGKSGRQWNKTGIRRFVNLVKVCKSYRVSEEKREIYKNMETMIMARERSTSTTDNRYDETDNSSSDEEDNDDENDTMEADLLAMANGEM